jgi:hypothetical protein
VLGLVACEVETVAFAVVSVAHFTVEIID